MKKNKIAFLGLLLVMTLTACQLTPTPTTPTDATNPEPVVETVVMNITGTEKVISVTDAATLDLKQLFTIKYDGASVAVTDEMISRGDFQAAEGEYTITLTYNNQTAVSKIKVVADSVLNPEPVVETVVKNIHLTASNEVVEVSEVENLDLRKLFSITNDGISVVVTSAMIDDGGLSATPGTYNVVLTYNEKTVTSVVTVVNDHFVTITTNPDKTVVKHGAVEHDLTEVFNVFVGSELVEITADMISGNVDYDRTGCYEVVMNYDRYGKVYNHTAVVTVLPDVEFATPNGDYFEGAYVFAANKMFEDENNFKVKVDGITVDAADLTFTSDFEYVEGTNNQLATGDYTTRCSFNVNGFDFYSDINYKIYKHSIKLSHSEAGKTYKKSEITADNFDVFDIITVKVDDYSLTSSSCKLQFVEASKVEDTEVLEGKELVAYTVESNLVYGTLGTYEVTISFEQDGRSFSDTATVNIVSDVTISKASKTDLTLFVGADAYDYKTLFTVKKYNAESDSNETVEITDAMIESNVDSTTVGTYDVTCTYEDASLTVSVNVVDAAFVGSYTAFDNEAFTLTINSDATVVINDNGSEKSGTITVEADGSLKISASGTYTCWYVDGILTYDRNHTSVTEANCHVLAKDVNSWTSKSISGFKGTATAVSNEGDTKYTVSEYTSGDKKVVVVFEYSLVYSDWWSGDEYAANYYVNPTVEGTLFEGSCDITLGNSVMTFTFDGESLTAAKKQTSDTEVEPSEPENEAYEKGTYTGELGDITLDGAGKASGEYFPANKTISYEVKENNVIAFSYNDANYNSHYFEITITTAEEGNGTYVVNPTDGLVYKYISTTSSSAYIMFYGYGNFNAYGIFQYSNALGSYEWNQEEGTVVLSFVNSDEESFVYTYKFTQYDNNLELIAYEGELYSSNARELACQTVRNYRLTSNKAYVSKGSVLDATSLFKIEYLDESGEVLTKEVNSSMIDTSAVDMNRIGFYVATLEFEEEGVVYKCSALIQVYDRIYADDEAVGTYNFGSSSYSTYSMVLSDDGKATYKDYNEYTGKWWYEDNQIVVDLSRATSYSTYYKKVVATYNNGVLTAFEDNKETPTLMVKDGKQLESYSYKYEVEGTSKTATLYMYDVNGFEHFYWLDNNEICEVKVRWNTMEIDDGSILNIYVGETMIEAQVDGSSLIGAGSEKGSWTGDKGTVVFDGFGNATVGDVAATYTVNGGKVTVVVNKETIVLELAAEGNTYQVLVADAVIGTYTLSSGSNKFDLDGFGAGTFTKWSASDIVYTYDEATKTLTINTFKYNGEFDDTFVFTVLEDGSLVCTSSTYSYYVAVDSVWTKN